MQRHHIQGFNGDVDIATSPEDLWAQGGTYAWPAAAAATTVVSDSANDTAAGTGARTVRVLGLDANYKEMTEDAILNGVTPVALVNQYLRINTLRVLTAGSGGTNAGVVAVKQSSTFLSSIVIGAGFARQAIFTASANQASFRIQRIFWDMLLNTSDVLKVRLWTRKVGQPWLLRNEHRGVQGLIDFVSPIHLDAGEDVRMDATAFADNTLATGGFEILAGSVPEFSVPR